MNKRINSDNKSATIIYIASIIVFLFLPQFSADGKGISVLGLMVADIKHRFILCFGISLCIAVSVIAIILILSGKRKIGFFMFFTLPSLEIIFMFLVIFQVFNINFSPVIMPTALTVFFTSLLPLADVKS